MKFTIACAFLQILFIILFGTLTEYGDYAVPYHKRVGEGPNVTRDQLLETNGVQTYYGMFQDVHVMIYIGFGFLMTFLKKYGYGAVGYNFFIAALVTQWATIISGCFNQLYAEGHSKIKLDLTTLIGAEFAAGCVLITYGAVLGKVSRLELLVIGFLEVVFYAINELIAVEFLKYSDAGGSLIIHAFGAYFGLAVARVLWSRRTVNNPKEGSVYHSDLFAMIGTVFLWMYWPSFNAALVAPDYVAQHRSVINTYFSLAAACVTTFALSPLFNKHWKLDMVHIQNATLAGGVAVGTASNMVIHPWGALLIGSTAGALSTLGYVYVTPFLCKFAKIHDTCGVHNLHGMPGLLGGIAGAIAASLAEAEDYGHEGLYNLFGARAPVANSTEHFAVVGLGVKIETGDGRSAQKQAGFQMAGLVVALVISIIGGLVTGFIIKLGLFDPATELFDDEEGWEVPQMEAVSHEGIHMEVRRETDESNKEKV